MVTGQPVIFVNLSRHFPRVREIQKVTSRPVTFWIPDIQQPYCLWLTRNPHTTRGNFSKTTSVGREIDTRRPADNRQISRLDLFSQLVVILTPRCVEMGNLA